MIQKRLVEERLAVATFDLCEISKVLVAEAEVADEIECVFEAGGDRVAAAERVVSEEEMKSGVTVSEIVLPIPLGHGELVQIRQAREGLSIDSAQCAQWTRPAPIQTARRETPRSRAHLESTTGPMVCHPRKIAQGRLRGGGRRRGDGSV